MFPPFRLAGNRTSCPLADGPSAQPAAQPSALPRRLRRRASRLTAAVVTAALAAGTAVTATSQPAAASSPTVTASAAQVNRAWWVADALLQNAGDQLAPFTYFEQLLQTLYRENPGMRPRAAKTQLTSLESAVQRQLATSLVARHGDATVPGILDVVQRAAGAQGISPVVRQAVAVTSQYFQNNSPAAADASEQVTGTLDLGAQSSAVAASADSVLQSVITMAQTPKAARFRQAQNAIFAPITAPTTATAQQIVQANPDMQSLGDINSLLGSDGQISTSLTDLNDLATSTLDAVQAQQAEAQQILVRVDSEQANVVGYATSNAHQAEKDADKAKTDAEQKTIDNAKSVVSVISTLIGLVDPSAGKTVEKVGSAVIQVATAVSKLAETASQLGGIVNAIGSFAGAAATGNIIGAVFSLVGLFGSSGPSVDQQILQEVDKLRQQVADLGKEMDQRFSRIDNALNGMYAEMMSQFDEINTQLGTINDNVVDVLDKLASLQTQLANLEGGLWSSLSDGFRRPLWDEIDSALGYEGRTGQPLSTSDFFKADSTFYNWGTNEAYDAAATGPSNRSMDETKIADELKSYTLDVDLGYLAQLPTIWGLPALSTSALPNPADWYLAARAYLALAQDYPQLAQQNKAMSQEVAGLETGGQRLQAFEKAITAGNLDANGLNPLFAMLISRYDAATQDIGNGVAQVEGNFKSAAGVDPYGGLNQALPYATSYTGITCRSGSYPLAASTIAQLVPGSAQLESVYDGYDRSTKSGGQGTLSICAHGQYTDEQVRGTGKIVVTTAELTADVSSAWNAAGSPTRGNAAPSGVLATQTVDLGRFTICTENNWDPEPQPCDPPDPTARVYDYWNTVQSKLASDTAVDVNTAERQALDNAANAYLAGLQQQMVAQVHQAFSTEPISSAAARQTGIVTAIRDYVLAGMPNAYAGDEELSSLLSSVDQALVAENDDHAISGAYTGDPAAEPWAGLSQTISQRRDALVAALGRDIAAIRNGAVDGSIATATTMNRLETLVPMVTTPAAQFAVGTATVQVPATKVGTARTLTYRVTDPGLGRLRVAKATVKGAGMRVVSQSCASVPGHGRCAVKVRYAPQAAGATTGVLTLATNTAQGAVHLRLQATATK